jgi:pimeloyl-ACP methyl ester carboxylesterase
MQLSELRLRDGRNLAWASYGDPTGQPVFYLHGAPATRLLHPSDRVAAEHGVRLISASRPGYGRSDFQPGRRVLDWPEDLEQLADHLGIERFAVVGASAGGPYVAACAWALPQRVRVAALVSSFGPVDAPGAMEGLPWERQLGVFLGRHAPWGNRALMATLRNPSRDTEAFTRRYSSHSCASDKAMLADPEFGGMMKASYAASCERGVRGFAHDVSILVRPWGFRLEEIRVPTHLWHAREDRGTPLPMAQAMAAAIPGCRTRWLEGGSHFVIFTHWAALLKAILGDGR